MTVIDGRTWLEVIQPEECWQLVARQPIGRIAVLVDGLPEIFPINHAVDNRTVVFRTDKGSKLFGLNRSQMVCFEVDGVDEHEQLGWSVMVKGRAVPVATARAMAEVATLPVHPWAPGGKTHWVRIQPVEVTGRRIRPGTEPERPGTDSRGYR
jgi:nitroimidazol reductase NimA-like FMN-containing flavoprotein (pyridoxamine 5'-phosphate oxidase superfamily)